MPGWLGTVWHLANCGWVEEIVFSDLIDSQQVGWLIQGTTEPKDNYSGLLAYKFGQESLNWLIRSRWCWRGLQQTYDREEHVVSWDAVFAVEFKTVNSLFNSLVKALAAGSGKVHFNGLFTEAFALERGARQGCPFAHILFAILECEFSKKNSARALCKESDRCWDVLHPCSSTTWNIQSSTRNKQR